MSGRIHPRCRDHRARTASPRALLRVLFPSLAVLLLAACTTSPGTAPPREAALPSDPAETVDCYEADRDLVTKVPAALCRGTIVDPRTAFELQAERSLRVQAAARRFGIGPETAGRAFIGSGTGILIGSRGEVLTSLHVIRRCAVASATAWDGVNSPGSVQAQDEEKDLAVLSTSFEGRATAAFSENPASASPYRLAVIGFPLQRTLDIRSSLTPALARPQDLASDARQFVVGGAIQPGHSGSPLVDQNGNVVGLVKAKIDSTEFYRRTGRVVDDIGLAVSSGAIATFLSAHGIPFRQVAAGSSLSDDEILAKARRFVVRINCWR